MNTLYVARTSLSRIVVRNIRLILLHVSCIERSSIMKIECELRLMSTQIMIVTMNHSSESIMISIGIRPGLEDSVKIH